MHNLFRIVFLFLALAVNAALAQQTIVYTVEGRIAKSPAGSFQWGLTSANTPGMGAGSPSAKPVIQDASLSILLGDAAVQFAQMAMRGENLHSVLVEFPQKNARQGDPAPFAMRLSDVVVTSVTIGKSGDGGPGSAEIKLKAGRIEMYSTKQDPTGKTYGSSKAGYDTRAQKAF